MSWKGSINLDLTEETLSKARELQNSFLQFGDSGEINKAKLYQLAIAIGVRNGEKKKLTGDTDYYTKVSNINREFFESLMAVLHPEEDEEDRLEILEQYAEYGMRKMYESFDETGIIEYNQFLEDPDEHDIKDSIDKFVGQIP